MMAAEWILGAVGLYAAVGVIVGAEFVIWGVDRVDAGAHGAPRLFRVLILPGAAALWPVVLRRWMTSRAEGHP